MRSRWRRRREYPTMCLDPLVKVCFQNVRRLFLPDYFIVLSNIGNKAEQSVVAVKREGPNSVIRHDRQISLSNDRLCIRWRSTHQFVASARDSECLSRLERIFGRSDY